METDSNMLPTAAAIGIAILDRDPPRDAKLATVTPAMSSITASADPVANIKIALPRMVHFHLRDKIGGKGVFNFRRQVPVRHGSRRHACALLQMRLSRSPIWS